MVPVILVDFLLFSGEFFSGGVSLAISIPIGIVIGLCAMVWQRKKYRDSMPRAIIKGLFIGFLTSIPTPVASILTFMAGILPLIDREKRESSPGKVFEDEHPMRQAKGRVVEHAGDPEGQEH